MPKHSVLAQILPYTIHLLCPCPYHERNRHLKRADSKATRTESDSIHSTRKRKQEIWFPFFSLFSEGQVAQGVTKEDLKFIVPYYSAYHSEVLVIWLLWQCLQGRNVILKSKTLLFEGDHMSYVADWGKTFWISHLSITIVTSHTSSKCSSRAFPLLR